MGDVLNRWPLLASMALLAAGCHRTVTVIYAVDEAHEFSDEEQETIESIAASAVREVRRCLPALPRELTLRVNAGSHVIDETGETGSAVQPATVYWTVDPARHGGVGAIAEKELRGTLFHELHHLVRGAKIENRSILDEAISEGLATAFERDHAGAAAPWGRYPAEAEAWLEELRALPEAAERRQWMFRHPDGRRWIGFKVGTYVVDRAQRASKKGPCELVTATTEEVLELVFVGSSTKTIEVR